MPARDSTRANGARQSQGLFISPLNTSTGMGIVSISLTIAVGHFVWGVVQPIAGAVADRYGPGRVLAAGVVAFALESDRWIFRCLDWRHRSRRTWRLHFSVIRRRRAGSLVQSADSGQTHTGKTAAGLGLAGLPHVPSF